MSTLEVNKLAPLADNGTVTLGDSGDTFTIPSGATITNSGTATGFGGITMADSWRITANFTPTHDALTIITSNWGQDDETGYGRIGSSMTESSGIFTFPQTGIYEVSFTLTFQGNSDYYIGTVIENTTNNSSYNRRNLSYAYQIHDGGGSSTGSVTTVRCLVDVTNTSNVKVRFGYNTNGASSIHGSTGEIASGAMFIRLGTHKMGTIFVDTLEPQSGTSLTLGASGDSIKGSTGAVWTGTVAESSSSSIVEKGSNSNGKFTKFADGTMICLMDETLTTPAVTTDIGNGGQTRSNNYTQSLPANFTDTSYQVSFSVGRIFMAGLSSNSEPSSTSQIGWHLRAWASATGDENVKVSIMAIGRWY